MSKFGKMGVVTDAAAKMPIIYPGEIDPVVDAQGREGFVEFLPWDSEPGRALDRKKNVDQVRKGFRSRSRAELRAEAEKEDPIEDQVERLVALATSWHLLEQDGTAIDVPFSKENARELFSAPEMGWLRRQAFAYVANEANFMKTSSKSS